MAGNDLGVGKECEGKEEGREVGRKRGGREMERLFEVSRENNVWLLEDIEYKRTKHRRNNWRRLTGRGGGRGK